MTRALILQTYRTERVPAWIERCMESVRGWAMAHGVDYRRCGDEVFDLCGPEYLARAGGNMRTITNLARLEMVRNAHAEGYDWAVWFDADIHIFDPARYSVSGIERYAFVGETWIELHADRRWRIHRNANNSVFVCRAGEPDLDFLIHATRHVAMHRTLRDNFQVGGDLVRGLRRSLGFDLLSNVGMFSHYVVAAIARDVEPMMKLQGEMHGAPVYAANLCATENYQPRVSESEVMAAMDRLEASGGDMINRWMNTSEQPPWGQWRMVDAPEIVSALGLAAPAPGGTAAGPVPPGAPGRGETPRG